MSRSKQMIGQVVFLVDLADKADGGVTWHLRIYRTAALNSFIDKPHVTRPNVCMSAYFVHNSDEEIITAVWLSCLR